MTKLCDLHVHSAFSDGTDTPAQLIAQAKELGLGAIALCDHNTVAGLPEFLSAARGSGVEAVPGIEFSAEYHGEEVHILGLFIPQEHYPDITALLSEMLQKKEKSNLALIEALTRAGICLSYEEIQANSQGNINRAVIASHMVAKGYCRSVKEAFSLWLNVKCGYYTPPERLDAFKTIDFIKSIGAVSVLAHPFLNLREQALSAFLRRAKTSGLDAMEVYYSLFTPEQTRLACGFAEEFGLKISGGSDYHGVNKPHIKMGVGQDNLQIPMAVLDQLR